MGVELVWRYNLQTVTSFQQKTGKMAERSKALDSSCTERQLVRVHNSNSNSSIERCGGSNPPLVSSFASFRDANLNPFSSSFFWRCGRRTVGEGGANFSAVREAQGCLLLARTLRSADLSANRLTRLTNTPPVTDHLWSRVLGFNKTPYILL